MFFVCSLLFFTACGNKQESEQKSGCRIEGDTVYVTDHFLLEKIKVSETESEPYSKKVITSGMVRPIPTRYAYVAPPFAGRVTNLMYESDNRYIRGHLYLKSVLLTLLPHRKNIFRQFHRGN